MQLGLISSIKKRLEIDRNYKDLWLWINLSSQGNERRLSTSIAPPTIRELDGTVFHLEKVSPTFFKLFPWDARKY